MTTATEVDRLHDAEIDPDAVYVHAATWQPPAAVMPEWVIANAPRPLHGRVIWEGSFRAGIFYAAGPDTADLRELWRRDGARIVLVITNDDIERMANAYAAANGYTPDDYREAGITIADLARDLGLPYVEDRPS
jgi:hypothetical protein